MRLSAYPYVVVRIACTRCPRKGRYRLARLAEKHAADITLPWLIERLAAGCERREGDKPNVCDPRGAYFLDVSGGRPPDMLYAMRPKLRVVRE